MMMDPTHDGSVDHERPTGEQTRLLPSTLPLRDNKDNSTQPQLSTTTTTTTTTTANSSSEFASSPVTRTAPWFQVSLIFIAGALSLPTFVTGMEVFLCGANVHDKNNTAVQGILLGNALLTAVAFVCGAVGARTHLSSYRLAQIAFGRYGAVLLNGTFAASLLAWFGVNLNLLSQSVNNGLVWWYFRNEEQEEHDSFLLQCGVQLLGGFVMTLTAMYGFRSLECVSLLLAPLLAGVTMLLFFKAVSRTTMTTTSVASYRNGSTAVMSRDDFRGVGSSQHAHTTTTTTTTVTLANDDTNTNFNLTLGQAISSVAGLSMVGAIITPDYTRYMSHGWRGALCASILAFGVVNSIVELVSGMATSVVDVPNNKHDLVGLFAELGLYYEALLLVVAGSWILNAMNLYSLALSVEVTLSDFPHCSSSSLSFLLEYKTLVAVLGVLGTFTASCQMLKEFLSFLLYLSVVFAPVAGVIVVDHLWVRPHAYHEENVSSSQAANSLIVPRALIAWTCGTGCAVLGCLDVIFLTGIAALDAFVVSAISYLLMSYMQGGWRIFEILIRSIGRLID